jgi:hypothetical protein
MIPGKSKKKESWLGVVITLVLCLGFLYWWFRPDPAPWHHENASQLVARAMKEPRPQNRVEQQVLDFDLMEIAICQASVKLLEDSIETAKGISDPVIKFRAVRQLAQSYLHTDPKDFARAVAFTEILTDPAERSAVRAEVLGSLAVAGFADAAVPEAKTALQKATLARRMAETDDESKNTARRLLAEAIQEWPSLPKPVADAVQLEIARTKVNLALTDGPAEAIKAIEGLPAPAQPELWEDLFGWCINRKDNRESLPLIMQHVKDPALRRKLETDSLLMHLQLRPAEELIAECKAEAGAAPSPAAKVTALIAMSEAQRATDTAGVNPAADATLKAALAAARTIEKPAERCRALIVLTRRFSDPPLLEEARPILEQAVKDLALVESLNERIALLVLASEESFKQSDEPLAVRLMEDAMKLMDSAPRENPPDAETMETLALAVLRRGDWPRGLALIERIPDNAARVAALDSATEKAGDDSISMDPGNVPSRGAPVDDIRRQAAGDEAKAMTLVEKQPAGYPRARAWLAMAKGLIAPPASLPATVDLTKDAPPAPDK